jgi:hypothetical protein
MRERGEKRKPEDIPTSDVPAIPARNRYFKLRYSPETSKLFSGDLRFLFRLSQSTKSWLPHGTKVAAKEPARNETYTEDQEDPRDTREVGSRGCHGTQ